MNISVTIHEGSGFDEGVRVAIVGKDSLYLTLIDDDQEQVTVALEKFTAAVRMLAAGAREKSEVQELNNAVGNLLDRLTHVDIEEASEEEEDLLNAASRLAEACCIIHKARSHGYNGPGNENANCVPYGIKPVEYLVDEMRHMLNVLTKEK